MVFGPSLAKIFRICVSRRREGMIFARRAINERTWSFSEIFREYISWTFPPPERKVGGGGRVWDGEHVR